MSNKVHILTYATHSGGLYEQLIDNDYDINVFTLGYGVKWNGLRDKPRAVLNYLTYVNIIYIIYNLYIIKQI